MKRVRWRSKREGRAWALHAFDKASNGNRVWLSETREGYKLAVWTKLPEKISGLPWSTWVLHSEYPPDTPLRTLKRVGFLLVLHGFDTGD